MRYTVIEQIIQVIGKIWMPSDIAAMEYQLTSSDVMNIGDVRDRESVERWLLTHSGDFSKIIDFRADFSLGNDDIVHDWNNPDSESTYDDCMYGRKDDE